jgi:hypothetical protein
VAKLFYCSTMSGPINTVILQTFSPILYVRCVKDVGENELDHWKIGHAPSASRNDEDVKS